jgi:hypothetical protein
VLHFTFAGSFGAHLAVNCAASAVSSPSASFSTSHRDVASQGLRNAISLDPRSTCADEYAFGDVAVMGRHPIDQNIIQDLPAALAERKTSPESARLVDI